MQSHSNKHHARLKAPKDIIPYGPIHNHSNKEKGNKYMFSQYYQTRNVTGRVNNKGYTEGPLFVKPLL